jgi:hypothetical protein
MEKTVYGDGTMPVKFARFGSVLQVGEIVDRLRRYPQRIGSVPDEIFGAYGTKRRFALQSQKLLIIKHRWTLTSEMRSGHTVLWNGFDIVGQ